MYISFFFLFGLKFEEIHQPLYLQKRCVIVYIAVHTSMNIKSCIRQDDDDDDKWLHLDSRTHKNRRIKRKNRTTKAKIFNYTLVLHPQHIFLACYSFLTYSQFYSQKFFAFDLLLQTCTLTHTLKDKEKEVETKWRAREVQRRTTKKYMQLLPNEYAPTPFACLPDCPLTHSIHLKFKVKSLSLVNSPVKSSHCRIWILACRHCSHSHHT